MEEKKPKGRYEQVLWLTTYIGLQGLEYATDRRVRQLFERYYKEHQDKQDSRKPNTCLLCGQEVKVQLICGCGTNEAITN
ncbi:hypothetical protein Theco_4059 (plasmid) [Thermobacillus composti KWC4]|jgi:hypothetical protein|uniref:Transposase n=1 Tax=Thermobacillus composti (strain DSM 18247 / JCM 13945 / KWC4) TaxID=717605 RepID=L0EL94_THECK|nr:hypothetical protein Theco_4059 [Thermobacillus composti KWC4]